MGAIYKCCYPHRVYGFWKIFWKFGQVPAIQHIIKEILFMLENVEKVQERLKSKLTAKRYIHTTGVRYTAAALAMRYGLSVEDASMAGVLHDCAKCFSDDELVRKCLKNNLECTETELRNGFLLHAKLGAYYAKKKYGIENEDIISAIRYHTTGKAGMKPLEAVVFTADYIEPGRKPLPHLEEVRRMAFVDIDEAVYQILDKTLGYLGEKAQTDNSGREIDVNTIEAFKYYRQIHKEKSHM